MMGVYIKGMKKPMSCDFCLISLPHVEELGCGFDLEHCPITEVPPHGRLIDETDVINHFVELANDPWNQNVSTSWGNAFAEAAGDICDMPTIIEAEEGE